MATQYEPIKLGEAYQRGMQSAIEDFRLTGKNETRCCPERLESSRAEWYLGRNRGFKDYTALFGKK